MLVHNFNHSTNVLYMEIPEGPKTRREHFKCQNPVHAEWIYNMNLSRYIVSTLRCWLKQRIFALHYMNEMTSKREYAVGALQLMLSNYAEANLQVLIRQINKHEDDFDAIIPGPKSRFLNYYNKRILPIRMFCKKCQSTKN